MNSQKRANFDRLLTPRHIALFGGSDVEVAIREAQRQKFSGQIWPVNPKRNEMLGLKCFKSVKDLPASPDASFIAIPSKLALGVVRDLALVEAGGIVCYAAGFSETGVEGEKLEKELTKLAGDMPIIGPNCYGFINYLENVALWPFAHGGWCPGFGVAIITQSGMLSSDITMTQRSLPITHMISVGNQCSVTIEDLIEILCENPKIRAIGVHIEGIKDICKFHNAALKSYAQNTPIVALKTGSSKIGGDIAVTHTGSLSGEDELYDALFERTGVIRVQSPVHLLETLKFLCISGIPSKNTLVAFTCSGGGAAMIADQSEKLDIALPKFDDKGEGELSSLLPNIATVSNPLDYTTPIWGNPEKTHAVFLAALENSNAGVAILLQDYPAEGLQDSHKFYLSDAKAFIEATKKMKIPAAVCDTFPENMLRKTRELFISLGVSPLQGLEEAVNAISLAAKCNKRYSALQNCKPKNLISLPPKTSSQFLTEENSKKVLNKIGLRIPKGVTVSKQDIANNKIHLQYPVVLKLLSKNIIHKSESGAVKVNIKNYADLKRKIEDMYIYHKNTLLDEFVDSFLVEQMQENPIVEMLVGIKSNQQFGYSLVLGSGGIQAEILNDAVTLLLPTTKTDIKSAIKSLKMYALMQGFRGQKEVNLKKLSATIHDLTLFFETNKKIYSSLEINPLFVYQNYSCAVDALISSRLID